MKENEKITKELRCSSLHLHIRLLQFILLPGRVTARLFVLSRLAGFEGTHGRERSRMPLGSNNLWLISVDSDKERPSIFAWKLMADVRTMTGPEFHVRLLTESPLDVSACYKLLERDVYLKKSWHCSIRCSDDNTYCICRQFKGTKWECQRLRVVDLPQSGPFDLLLVSGNKGFKDILRLIGTLAFLECWDKSHVKGWPTFDLYPGPDLARWTRPYRCRCFSLPTLQ